MSTPNYASSLPRMQTILGIDPGFAAMGMALLTKEGDGPVTCRRLQVAGTKKGNKKVMRNLRVADDDRRRFQELHEELRSMLLFYQDYSPTVVAYEVYQPFGGRMGGNAWKVARCEGLVQGVALERGLLVLPFLPMDLKKGIAGKLTASKEQVQKALRKKLAGFSQLVDEVAADDQEHVSDAAGYAYLAFDEVAQMRRHAGVA